MNADVTVSAIDFIKNLLFLSDNYHTIICVSFVNNICFARVIHVTSLLLLICKIKIHDNHSDVNITRCFVVIRALY